MAKTKRKQDNAHFYITEIPGPYIMKKIAEGLGFNAEQIKLINTIKPYSFPMYMHSTPETRYWYGSNPAMMNSFGNKIHWKDALEFLANKNVVSWQVEIVNELEKDLHWTRVALKNVRGSVISIIGD